MAIEQAAGRRAPPAHAAWAAAGRLPVQVAAVPSLEGPGKARWARVGKLAGAGRLAVLDLPPLRPAPLVSALTVADVVLLGRAGMRHTGCLLDRVHEGANAFSLAQPAFPRLPGRWSAAARRACAIAT
jgi:hypothetical protein